MTGFTPISNFTGANAGQQFRNAVNDALGGSVPISPAISGSDVSAAVAAASITNAASRTIEAWKTDAINFADYAGADPTGATDMSSLMATALADARSQGKALYFPSGTWGYANLTTIQAGDRIFGAGDRTIFQYMGALTSGAVQTCFSTAALGTISAPNTYSAPTMLADFRVIGGVDQIHATYAAGLAGSLLQIQGCNTVVVQRLRIENAALVGLMVNFNYNLLVDSCDFYQCCRDNCMFSGTHFARITNNRFRHGGDNCISCHANCNQAWGRGQLIIIQGNLIEDCPGIAMQAAARTIITDNVLVRPRELGIGVQFVGSTGGGVDTEGMASLFSVTIANNQIYDVIANNNMDGQNQGVDYIEIGTYPPRAGSGYGVPGTNLQSLGGSVITTRIPSTQTWQANTVYPQGALIVDSNGKVQKSLALANWAASTAYVVGQEIFDGNGNVQHCTTAGTSGSAAPTWATTQGTTTADGAAVWTLYFVMPVNQPNPTGTNTFAPYQPTSGRSAPTWATTFDATCYDGGSAGTPGVRWQNQGSNSAAGVVETYPYIDNALVNHLDTTTPIGPGLYIDVRGNQCIRTISVTNPIQYSSLGFGQMFDRWGYLNPVLGQEELQSTANGIGIFSENSAAMLIKQLRITDNRIVGVGSSIEIQPGVQIMGGEISGNEFYDFLNFGIKFASASVNHRIILQDNLFDGDPHMLGRGSGTNGAWQSNTTLVIGCQANSTTGILARGNRYRNVMAVDDGNAGSWQYEDNWVYCEPAAVGFSTSNLGVGTVPAAGPAFSHVIENCNTSSASFGTLVNMPVLSAAAMPSSGTYVAGQFVANSAPAVTSGFVLMGWIRLTTGSGNVSGTDWSPVWAAIAS